MATVQIRNLDDEAYEVLRTRAADSGRSLQEYLRLLLERAAGQEARGDFWKRYRAELSWPGIELRADEAVRLVHEGRR